MCPGSVSISNPTKLSVYEMDRMNNTRRRELDRGKIEDKTISQVIADNYSDAKITKSEAGVFVERAAGLENIQFYLAIMNSSTERVIQIGLPSDGKDYFPGANELRFGADLFELNKQLKPQGLELVLIMKDETNSKFDMTADLRTGPNSLMGSLSPFSDPTRFDAGLKNLKNQRDNFFSDAPGNFCISCGGGAKKETLDVDEAELSFGTSDSSNVYSLGEITLYSGEKDSPISLELKFVPELFASSSVPQPNQPNAQLPSSYRQMDSRAADGSFFLVWNSASYADASRNPQFSNSDSAVGSSPFQSVDSGVQITCEAKKEPATEFGQTFDGISNLRFFHITEDFCVVQNQKSGSVSGESAADAPKQYAVKLSPFTPQEQSQLMRLLMNPTERKLWGRLFGLPDDEVQHPPDGYSSKAMVSCKKAVLDNAGATTEERIQRIPIPSIKPQTSSPMQLSKESGKKEITEKTREEKKMGLHPEAKGIQQSKPSESRESKQTVKGTNADTQPEQKQKKANIELPEQQEPRLNIPKAIDSKRTPHVLRDMGADEGHEHDPDDKKDSKPEQPKKDPKQQGKKEESKRKEQEQKAQKESEDPRQRKDSESKLPKDAKPKPSDGQQKRKDSKGKKKDLAGAQEIARDDPKLKREEKRKERQEKRKVEGPKLQEKKEYGAKKAEASESKYPKQKPGQTKPKPSDPASRNQGKKRKQKRMPSFLLSWILARKERRRKQRLATGY